MPFGCTVIAYGAYPAIGRASKKTGAAGLPATFAGPGAARQPTHGGMTMPKFSIVLEGGMADRLMAAAETKGQRVDAFVISAVNREIERYATMQSDGMAKSAAAAVTLGALVKARVSTGSERLSEAEAFERLQAEDPAKMDELYAQSVGRSAAVGG